MNTAPLWLQTLAFLWSIVSLTITFRFWLYMRTEPDAAIKIRRARLLHPPLAAGASTMALTPLLVPQPFATVLMVAIPIAIFMCLKEVLPYPA